MKYHCDPHRHHHLHHLHHHHCHITQHGCKGGLRVYRGCLSDGSHTGDHTGDDTDESPLDIVASQLLHGRLGLCEYNVLHPDPGFIMSGFGKRAWTLPVKHAPLVNY